MSQIHPSAVIDRSAQLGRDVIIGPYCYVGPDVILGDNCELISNVTLLGPSRFGSRNQVYPFCVLGAAPQDLKFKGGPTRLEVGDANIFREYVTAHRGTEVDVTSGGVTKIGDKNLFMIGAHIAHDSEVGSHVIIANAVQIAGHVRIEDCVNIGGVVGIHHFVTIGRNSFVGGMSRITKDVPPYVKVQGYKQAVRGLNIEGIRRWDFSESSISNLKKAARLLFPRKDEQSVGRTKEALMRIESDGLMNDDHVAYLVNFLRRQLDKGVFGRIREHFRSDSDQDREGFYGAEGEVKS